MKENKEVIASFKKVTAFVIRWHDDRLQMLTFLHPEAGRQLPAGSVENGEPPIDAALREVKEETGLVNIESIHLLDREEHFFSDQFGVLSKTCYLSTSPDGAAGELRLKRGYKIVVEERQERWIKIRHDIYGTNVEGSIAVVDVKKGWVPKNYIADKLLRYFYILKVSEDGRHRWLHEADGHTFTLEWLDLEPRPVLVDVQQEWLETYADQIANASYKK